MATQKWPFDLPYCFLIRGYTETEFPTVIRTEMDVGPAKIRRRYTKAIGLIRGEMIYTLDELKKFWTFFHVTLQGGSLPFHATSDMTGETGDYRFTASPSVSAWSDTRVTVQFALEKIS